MWSSLAAVAAWTESLLGVRTGSYPPANSSGDYAVVNRVGGDTEYPHDFPRYAIQIWTDSDENGEQVALALSRMLPTLAQQSPRINAVDRNATITQLGRDENGHYVWQVAFSMSCNILDE